MSTYAQVFRDQIDEAIARLNGASEALELRDPGAMAFQIAEAEALCAGILMSYGQLSRQALDTLSQEKGWR
jgi:hypothetical protein